MSTPIAEATPCAGRGSRAACSIPSSCCAHFPDAVKKLNPLTLWRNPVMFIVEIGSVFTTVLAIRDHTSFAIQITVWLWLTVLFANLAEAVAEGRGKAQADALRGPRPTRSRAGSSTGTPRRPRPRCARKPYRRRSCPRATSSSARRATSSRATATSSTASPASTSRRSPASPRPVIRESGGDRSSVTGGTKVLSDRIVVQITQKPGESFIDRMIALVEGASRQKTPNEIALNILLASLTIIFLLAVVTLQPLAIFSKANQPGIPNTSALDANGVTGIVLVSLLVCLIPTTIGALLSAIGIAGMDRLVQRNVLAMSGRAVEAAGDVDTLLLDKTGTITLGNRQASEFIAGRHHQQG